MQTADPPARRPDPEGRKAVAARLRGETVISFATACVLLDAREPIVRRWMTRGRGGRVLESFHDASGQAWTSLEAVARFSGGKAG
jgi:hypothetical protein